MKRGRLLKNQKSIDKLKKQIMTTEIIVCCSISEPKKKDSIVAMLQKFGIKEQIDQSSWYGSCLVELDNFIRIIRMARVEYELTKTDTIRVYYAEGNTIKRQGVRIYSF